MSITPREVRERVFEICSEVAGAVIGKEEVLRLIMMGIVSSGHILLEDYPGLAKTTMVRLFARALGLEFRRVQFTPDLLPGDITGGYIYNQKSGEFTFRPGPIFTHFLLADEINRGNPKTQSALLEVMQEGQVTVEGESFNLEPPFAVLATQNPIEFSGTYPLPEAQLDRFIMRLSVGYPGHEDELRILLDRQSRGQDDWEVRQVVGREELLAIQQAAEAVYVNEDVASYMVEIVSRTRDYQQVEVGASPRGSLALFKLSRASALMEGRDFVTPDDVKRVAEPALAHRILVKPELWGRTEGSRDIVENILRRTPTPATRGGGG